MTLSKSERAKKWQQESLEKGLIVFIEPFGYIRPKVYDRHTTQNLLVDPFQAMLVKEVFELYATGNYSDRKIIDHIFKTYNYLFNRTGFAHIITNPFYCGFMSVKGKLYPHNYQQLVSKELFDKVQAIRSKKTCRKNVKTTQSPRYRQKIRCSDCSCYVSAQFQKTQFYYHCSQSRYQHKAPYITEHAITDAIVSYLNERGYDGNAFAQETDRDKLDSLLRVYFVGMTLNPDKTITFVENPFAYAMQNHITTQPNEVTVAQRILNALSSPLSLDELSAKLNISSNELADEIFNLEMSNLIVPTLMGKYEKTAK